MPDGGATALASPLDVGAALLPGYTVAGHLGRSRYLDIYELWSEERACYCVAKVVRPDWRHDRMHQRDLLREGRLLKRLTHMHLVRAYEVHTTPEPIIILESVIGPTLAQHLARRTQRLPFGRVTSIGMGIATAVRYLHRHGLLHLDISPSNIILQGPIAKVIDLSAARPPGRGRARWGTDAYMAPEQVRGGNFSAATDAWGIGAVLFEVATGQQAFPWDETTGIHRQMLSPAPPLHTMRRTPAAFARIIDGCLDPEPSHRPAIDEIVHVFDDL